MARPIQAAGSAVPVLSVVTTAAPIPPLGLASGPAVGAGEALPVGPVFLPVPEPVTEPGVFRWSRLASQWQGPPIRKPLRLRCWFVFRR